MAPYAWVALLMLALYGLVAALLDLAGWLGSRNALPAPVSLVSILVLVKNREDVVERFIRRLCSLGITAATLPYEVVAVDDFSTDQTWGIIQRLCSSLTTIKAVRMADVSSPGEGAEGIGLFMCAGEVAIVCSLAHGTDDLALLSAIKGMLRKPRKERPVGLMW